MTDLDHHQRESLDDSKVLADVWLFLDNCAPCGRDRGVILDHLRDNGPTLARYGLDEKLSKLLDSPRSSPQLRDTLQRQIRVAVLDQADVTVDSGFDGVTTTVSVRTLSVEEQLRADAFREPPPSTPAPAAARLLARGVQILPVHARSRYEEELGSELCELVDMGASRRQQVIYSLRLWVRMWALRRALRSASWSEEQAG